MDLATLQETSTSMAVAVLNTRFDANGPRANENDLPMKKVLNDHFWQPVSKKENVTVTVTLLLACDVLLSLLSVSHYFRDIFHFVNRQSHIYVRG